MKKSFLKKIMVFLLILVIAGGSIFASKTSAILKLTGTIEKVFALNVTEASTFEINPSLGFTKESISTGTYYSNNLSGFTVAVSSVNGGLKNGENIIPYTLYLDDDLTGILISTVTSSNPYIFIETNAPSTASETFNIEISVAAVNENALWPAGTYKDKLRFTLTNK